MRRARARGSARRILAIRAGALGDTILALPALEALRRGAARLEVVGTAPYVDLVPADAAHAFDRAMFRAFFDEGVGDTELRELLQRCDVVVAWSDLPRLTRLADGMVVIQASPFPPPGVHASDHLLATLEPLGLGGPAPSPRVETGARPAWFPERYLALHPGSGSPAKNWSPEKFGDVAELGRASGLDIVWIEGEADRDVVSPLAREVPGTLARELPLDELAAVLADARAYVGNDSGVSHLAAAVGAPTVAVFVATDPVQWAPRGAHVLVTTGGASPEAVWGLARDCMAGR